MERVLITPVNEAKRFIIDCFKAVGVCPENDAIMAENLIQADIRGHYSHGMNRLTMYINHIVSKSVDPNAAPQIEKETVSTALVNGKNGLGAVIGKYSMDLAIEKATDAGIGMVTVHGSNHYGIAGMYTLQAIEAGYIGITLTNTTPLMVPTRAKEAALGTNPISIGAPAQNGDSFVLDMSTTTVAVGKLELYKRKGQSIPEGWALNDDGNMETNPEVGIKARKLLPLGGDELNGGYKGYGSAMVVELLSGILAGANYGTKIPTWQKSHQGAVANLGHAFIAINPKAFATGFEERLSDLISSLRQMEPRDPNKPVLVPGDLENTYVRKVKAQGGLCYVQDQHDTNNKLAEDLKVAPMISVCHSEHTN